MANSLVVLFAKSGIGKPSLLSAGLVPLLDYDRFQTVKVRFQNTGSSPTVMGNFGKHPTTNQQTKINGYDTKRDSRSL